MLDQTFTAENFRKIYDQANRRGINLEARFFPALNDLTDEVRQKSIEIKACRKLPNYGSSSAIQAQVEVLKRQRDELKLRKSEAIDAQLEIIATRVRSDSFSINLRRADGPGGKPVYPALECAENFFVLRLLQENLGRLYGVKQSNRHRVVTQLRDTLDNGFNWYVVKTDISAFYESIDRGKLIKKISSDQLLSVSSKSHIRRILERYGALSGDEKGVPRGVGISAYLAELYMRALDRQLRNLPAVVFYARYVDDIVVVFARTRADDTSAMERSVCETISEHGLTPNPDKTDSWPIGPSENATFDYLGYRFHLAGGRCLVHVSAAKLTRYKNRIRLCFEDFNRKVNVSPKGSRRLLIARLKFLTGNTRLQNSKKNAMTGVYSANSAITTAASLRGLDTYKDYLAVQTGIASLQNRVARLSFVTGFEERTFRTFTLKEIGRIVEAWQHEAA